MELTGGAALAIVAIAKLTPMFLVPYVWWRGSRRAAGFALLLGALSMQPAIQHWGPGIVTSYLQDAILPAVRDDVSPPMNQSLDAFLSRLFVPSDVVAAPFDAPGLARLLSTLGALAIVVLTLQPLARRNRAPGLLPVELGLVLLAILLLMKLTWVHTLAAAQAGDEVVL